MTLRAFLVLVGTCAALDANVWPDSRRLDGTGVSGVTARASPPTSTSRFGSGNASTVVSKVLLLDGAQSSSGGRQGKSCAPLGCPVIRPRNPAVHDAAHDNQVRSDRRAGSGSTTKELPGWRVKGFNSVGHRGDVPVGTGARRKPATLRRTMSEIVQHLYQCSPLLPRGIAVPLKSTEPRGTKCPSLSAAIHLHPWEQSWCGRESCVNSCPRTLRAGR